jgi:hypothetical protein
MLQSRSEQLDSFSWNEDSVGNRKLSPERMRAGRLFRPNYRVGIRPTPCAELGLAAIKPGGYKKTALTNCVSAVSIGNRKILTLATCPKHRQT